VYPDRVEDLIRTLRNAKMDITSATDDAKTAAAFKSAGPFASAKITGACGTQEVEIRKMKDDCYVKSSAVSGVYKVSSSVGAELDKSLDDFRNEKLFDFGYQDPNKIEIHNGPKSYFFTHSGSDWWGPDGQKLDEDEHRSTCRQTPRTLRHQVTITPSMRRCPLPDRN
jgi:hypothetical protein